LQETPVVGFDVNYGPSDIVGTHGSILSTRDEDELAKEILRYFRDERLRQMVGSEARRSVLDRFGEDAVFAKWAQLLG
jgi:glycosyltransferase involved in cell wall biosynthesis